MKRILLLLYFFACVSSAFAQEKDSNNGYRGYVDFALGDAYNVNTAQTVSTNNMQCYSEITITHGYVLKNWFVGAGVGYYHSFRDKENMYPIYAAGRYTFGKVKLSPFIEARAGVVYDPYWIEKVQKYGMMSIGVNVNKVLQVGLRGELFSRPSRLFTANAAVVFSYAFGK